MATHIVTARASLRERPVATQAASRVPAAVDEDARVVLAWLDAAMKETGWTQEALAAWFKEQQVRSADRQYIQKMLTGEKPITLRDVIALPDDLEAAFLTKWTRKFEPSEQELMGRVLMAIGDAMRVVQLRTLPAKAGVVAKAGLK